MLDVVVVPTCARSVAGGLALRKEKKLISIAISLFRFIFQKLTILNSNLRTNMLPIPR